MITTTHQTSVDRCLTIIANKLYELAGILSESDEKTYDTLRDMLSDCPIENFEELADNIRHFKQVIKGRMEREIQKNNRQYIGIWGSWYTGPGVFDDYEHAQTVLSFSSFTEDKGYSEEDIKAIDELIVGGAPWHSSNRNHIVLRIK